MNNFKGVYKYYRYYRQIFKLKFKKKFKLRIIRINEYTIGSLCYIQYSNGYFTRYKNVYYYKFNEEKLTRKIYYDLAVELVKNINSIDDLINKIDKINIDLSNRKGSFQFNYFVLYDEPYKVIQIKK